MTIVIIALIIIAIIVAVNWKKGTQQAIDDGVLIAMDGNRLDGIKNLINSGEIKINQKVCNGKSLLILAAMYGRSEIVEYLISKGANINYKDDRGWTALSYVYASVLNRIITTYTCEKTAKLMLKNGANPNIKNDDGRTPTMYAASIHNNSIMKDLEEHGANIDIRDNKGYTARMIMGAY